MAVGSRDAGAGLRERPSGRGVHKDDLAAIERIPLMTEFVHPTGPRVSTRAGIRIVRLPRWPVLCLDQPGEDSATLSQVIEHENSRMSARAAWGPLLRRHRRLLLPGELHARVPPRRQTPSTSARSQPGKESGPTATKPSGSRTLHCRAYLPWSRRSDEPPPASPSAQIIGPLYEDDTALTFAELLAQVIGG